MSYNDGRRRTLSESSESDIQPSSNQFQITSNPAKPAQIVKHSKYNESSESDISSLSEDSQSEEQMQRVRGHNNKKTIEVDASDDSSDEEASSQSSGIDVIEQRIKRLEVDLEAKIQKQKHNTVTSKLEPRQPESASNCHKLQPFKNQPLSNPPLPPSHRQQAKHASIPSHNNNNILPYSQSENLNRLNLIERDGSMKETTKDPKVQPQKSEHYQRVEAVLPVKKTSIHKDSQEKHSPSKKSRIASKNTKGKEMNAVGLLNKAHRQIDQMQKVIDELRKQNQILKQQLGKSKKKHSTEEIQKLRKLSSGTGDLKLEKQIETLKAIQSLESKLKKSIAKKLKSQRITSKNSAIAQQI